MTRHGSGARFGPGMVVAAGCGDAGGSGLGWSGQWGEADCEWPPLSWILAGGGDGIAVVVVAFMAASPG